MTKYEMRQVAAGAARSLLRQIGPLTGNESAEDAWLVLDELSRKPENENLVAVQWFKYSSENQYKLFNKEWERWQRKSKQDTEDLKMIAQLLQGRAK